MSGFHESPQFGECLAWFNEAPIGPIFRLWRSIENGWNRWNPYHFPFFFCGSSVDLWVIFQPSTCLSHFLFFCEEKSQKSRIQPGFAEEFIQFGLRAWPKDPPPGLGFSHPLLNGPTLQIQVSEIKNTLVNWLLEEIILPGFLGIMITHGRESYQPTSTMRWDRGIFNGSGEWNLMPFTHLYTTDVPNSHWLVDE